MNLVYQNIEESTYYVVIGDIKFYFSSLFNLKRFREKCFNYIENESRKIINRYHFKVNLDKYLLISFYSQIEKRGFLLEINNNKYNKEDIKILTILL